MALPDTPLVSVAVPVYNGQRYLREALTSVRDQTRAPDEVLVFDNASTDSSRDIVAEVLGADAIRGTEVNRGAAWNFSRAVDECSGEFFAWLADDDRWQPGYLARCVESLERDPSVAACHTAVQLIDTDGRPVRISRAPGVESRDVRTRLRAFATKRLWLESYCLYRRSELARSPRFQDGYGPDVVLAWWFLLRGRLTFIDEPLMDYRIYPHKTLDQLTEGLSPGARPQHFRMWEVWRGMWRQTADPEVTSRVRRIARQELLLALARPDWLVHNGWDGILFVRHLWRRTHRRRTS